MIYIESDKKLLISIFGTDCSGHLTPNSFSDQCHLHNCCQSDMGRSNKKVRVAQSGVKKLKRLFKQHNWLRMV